MLHVKDVFHLEGMMPQAFTLSAFYLKQCSGHSDVKLFYLNKESAQCSKTHDLLESQYLELSPGQLYASLTLESHLEWKWLSYFSPEGSELDGHMRPIRLLSIHSTDLFT